jgi:hypothetical protein
MDRQEADEFVERWIRDWNAHDVEAVVSHFAQDVVFRSPVAARIVPESGGVIRGKEALLAYWLEGVRLIPELQFELICTYVGVDTIVINYRNQAGGLVNEVLRFEDGLVVEGYGTYLNSEPVHR